MAEENGTPVDATATQDASLAAECQNGQDAAHSVNGTTTSNADGTAVNGANGLSANDSAQLALQRGMEMLKGSEIDPSIEEMKKLDSQIDHFNTYLDKFEAKNNELNAKLNKLLETQKEEGLKRRASLQQREAENKEQSEALRDQMQALLSRCHVARRVTVADISENVEQNGTLPTPSSEGQQ